MRGPVVALVMALVVACTSEEPRTQVVVTIDAEAGVRTDAIKLRVVVRGGPAGALQERTAQVVGSVETPVRWPVRIGIIPLDGDASRVFAVEATAVTAADETVSVVRATSTFLPRRTLGLPLLLEDCCRPVFPMCTLDETCRECTCVLAAIDPDELDDFGLDGGGRADSGVRDAGSDSGPRDAGPRDSGPRDGGPSDGGGDPRCTDPLMFFAGTVCMDRSPALTESGEQGPALNWDDANALCVSRGARLCTEEERESPCDGTGDPYSSANREFCIGDAGDADAGRPIAETWEWLAGMCAAGTYRRSPCCGVISGFGECSTMPSMMASYHCCASPAAGS